MRYEYMIMSVRSIDDNGASVLADELTKIGFDRWRPIIFFEKSSTFLFEREFIPGITYDAEEEE